jgi:vacuolar-type H+-ATPase subunit I/STV1
MRAGDPQLPSSSTGQDTASKEPVLEQSVGDIIMPYQRLALLLDEQAKLKRDFHRESREVVQEETQIALKLEQVVLELLKDVDEKIRLVAFDRTSKVQGQKKELIAEKNRLTSLFETNLAYFRRSGPRFFEAIRELAHKNGAGDNNLTFNKSSDRRWLSFNCNDWDNTDRTKLLLAMGKTEKPDTKEMLIKKDTSEHFDIFCPQIELIDEVRGIEGGWDPHNLSYEKVKELSGMKNVVSIRGKDKWYIYLIPDSNR